MQSSTPRERILVVDDVPLNAMILLKGLQSEYDVVTASNGEDALRIACSENPPDLILLDVMMIGMDGYEVCSRLKSDPRTSNVPVIFVTAKGELEDETKGLECGAVDYVVKPFRMPIVKARVKTHLILKEQREEQERMAKNLEQLNQTKNKFLGMAAHDLRNPLISIRGLSEFLTEGFFGPLNEKQLEVAGIIHSAVRGMLSLVNDLLDISIIESGRLTLQLARASLNELVLERIAMNRIAAGRKQITIHSRMDCQVEACFDANRLGQVLDNLLGNAVKFSGPGSNIHVLLDADQRAARISVRDEGPGIRKEDQVRLFDEFQKLDIRPTGGEEGTGLGLAIVKKIVQAHGGTLLVESRVGRGSTFTFTIPIERSVDEASDG
jgi:two-component system, sensor histidine kinase and response regulator